MSAPTEPTPIRPGAATPARSEALAGLARRLLQPADPVAADALWRAGRPDEAAILALLEARAALRPRVLDGCAALRAAGGRALCLPERGPPVLLEAVAEGRYRTVFEGGGVASEVGERALDGLFPCPALIVPLPRRGAGSAADTCRWGLAAALRLLHQILGLALPLAMLIIVDKVVAQGATTTLTALLLGVALLTGLQYVFGCAHAVHVSRTVELHAQPQRRRIVDALLRCRGAAQLSAAGWDAIQSALDSSRFLAESRPQLVADGLFVLLLAVLMGAFHPLLLAVALAFLPLCAAVEMLGGRRAERAAGDVSGLRVRAAGRYFEAAEAPADVHQLDLAAQLTETWQSLDVDLAAERLRLGTARRLTSLTVELVQKVFVLVIMLLGVRAVIDGTMTLGQYIAFNLLAMQLGAPALRTATFWRAWQDHRIRNGAIRRLLQRCAADRWPAGGCLSGPPRQPCLLRVTRVRPHVELPVEPLSFDVLGGSWLGVTGPSGCGKSTLLRCLAGVAEPGEGDVLLDGLPVHELRPDVRARRIRLVPQQPRLFSTSVADNIRLGDPAAAPEAIYRAAAVCGLTEPGRSTRDGLGRIVGRGGSLSGGERQRVALARAILSQPSVLLLDEATAALDGAAELTLFERLRAHLPQTAVVVVSHRPGTLGACDRVLRLGARSTSPYRGRAA